MVWLPVLGIFKVHTDVDACDCTRGLYGHHKRVCTGSWQGEKSLATLGTQTHVSVAPGFSVGRSTNWAILGLQGWMKWNNFLFCLLKVLVFLMFRVYLFGFYFFVKLLLIIFCLWCLYNLHLMLHLILYSALSFNNFFYALCNYFNIIVQWRYATLQSYLCDICCTGTGGQPRYQGVYPGGTQQGSTEYISAQDDDRHHVWWLHLLPLPTHQEGQDVQNVWQLADWGRIWIHAWCSWIGFFCLLSFCGFQISIVNKFHHKSTEFKRWWRYFLRIVFLWLSNINF